MDKTPVQTAAGLMGASPTLLAIALEHVSEALLITDPQGRIQYVNSAFAKLTGYTATEAVGQTPRMLKSSHQDPAFYEELWRTILAGKVWEGALINKHKNGLLYTEEMTITPVRDPEGAICNFIAVQRDVTEPHAADASRALLASLVESSSDAIFGMALDGTILSWNKGAEALYGYGPEEIIGKAAVTLVPPERHETFRLAYREVKRGGVVRPYEAMGLRKDGTEVFVSAAIAPILNPAGSTTASVAVVRDISAQKRTEAALQTAASNLREVERIAQLASWELDIAEQELHGSEQLFRLFHFPPSRAALPLAKALRAIHPADRERVRTTLQETARTHEPFEVEHRIVGRDANVRMVRSRGQVVIGPENKLLRLVGSTLDITDYRLAHQKLTHSEEKYRSLVLNIPDVIWTSTLAGDTIYISPNIEKIYGFTAEEVYKRGKELWLQRIHPTDSKQVIEALEGLFTEGRPFDVEYQVQHKDGRWIWIHDRAFRTYEKDGVRCADGIFSDITERKRAEAQLRKLSRAVEESPVCVVITDVQGNIEYVNPKFTRLTGYTLEEILGENPRFLKSGLTSHATYQELWRAIVSGAEWRGEFANKKKGGEIYWESAWISPIKDSRGATTNFIAVKEDITERKAVEQQLRKATETAEAANHAKSQFLATISHEIRTPMNGVIGMIGLLLETELTTEQQRYAEMARSSGKALLEIINTILDFSKIEAGKLALETTDFDLYVPLQYAVELLAVKAQEKGLELTCLVAPETPSQLRGDPSRIQQILVNLVGNAVKFTHQGEVAVSVKVESEDERAATLRFTVRDTGIGFPQDQAAALFAPFVQADGSTTRRYGGTGLGLAISKRLVGMMGGHIGVQSIEGRGSEFWFSANFGKQPEAEPSGSADYGLAGTRVLVVDDNATSRALIRQLLGFWRCDCEEAVDAVSALAALRGAADSGHPFRVAFLDISLPSTNGEDLGRQIAADPPLHQTSLFLMTPVGKPSQPARLRELGFAGQLSKPVWAACLRKALEQVVHERAGCPPVRSEDAPRKESASAAKPGARILVAEDNSINQEVIFAILNKLGHCTEIVRNGAQAVTALEQTDYDLVLMDCLMPEVDGYEATRRIRESGASGRNSNIPIIALTADAMEGSREKCIAAGMNDYLTKPVEPQQLAEALARWIVQAPVPALGEQPSNRAPKKDDVFQEDTLLNNLMGDKVLARTVLAGFLSDAPRQLRNLKKQIEQHDAPGAMAQAHTLKGAAATISAAAFCAVSSAMQQAATAGDLNRATELLLQLDEEFRRLKDALKRAGWV